MIRHRIAVLFVLLATSGAVFAEVVDDFTAAQGPLTVGPGEEPPLDEAVRAYPNVLGGFRVLTPAVGEDSAPGSTATAQISGGEFRCDVAYGGADEDNGGGCAAGWAGEEDGQTFDLTVSESFDIEVLEANPGAIVAVVLFDETADIAGAVFGDSGAAAIGFIESPTPGTYTLPIDQFISPADPLNGFDANAVTAIVLVSSFEEGFDGTVRLGAVTTAGPIGEGPQVDPPDDPPGDDTPSDEDLRQLASGSYFDPTRSGEGCQVTVEGDGVTVIITCYFYRDGEQAWFISNGVISDGKATFDLIITEGADYGADFDPDDVVRTPWGTGTFSWIDCNQADLVLTPVLPGYEAITLDLQKIVPNDCSGAGPDPVAASYAGTLYDIARSGEGFHITQMGDTNTYALAWYTYLNGQQVWLFGSGERVGNVIEFSDTVITRGTGWGPNFNAADVVRDPWGTITLEYSDCANASFTATPLPGQMQFTAVEGQVSELVAGVCP